MVHCAVTVWVADCAACVKMVSAAIEQHGLPVASITEWLQRQKCGRYVTPLLAPRSTILSIRCSPTSSVWPGLAFLNENAERRQTNLVRSSLLFFWARPTHLPNIRVGLALAQIPARLLRKLSVVVADAVEVLFLELFQIEQPQVSAFD